MPARVRCTSGKAACSARRCARFDAGMCALRATFPGDSRARRKNELGEHTMDYAASRPRWLIATLLALSSLATSAVHAQGGVIHGRDSNRMRYMDLHGQKLVNGQRDVEVFVRLDEPAVSELNLQSVETTGAFATPEA